METNVVKERLAFVHDLESGHWSMTELCERYGVSRPTGYKWLERHQADGGVGLTDRSRAPQWCPHRTSDAQEELIIATRLDYGWGAKKLLRVLRTRHPSRAWPARSTVNVILERRGLLRKHRRRHKWAHPGAAPVATQRPNQIWPADFKGQFRTGDGRYCYPLTVTDHFSRRILTCHGLRSVKTVDAKPIFRALFREVGLPDAIRTDNGAPVASTGIHGLAALNVWWIQLGIVHQRITPANPQENGTHERMHRELKRETARPAASSLRAQQRRFDAFCQRYNDERPHEGIGDRTPSILWCPSSRPYPERRTHPDYPLHMEIRRVSTAGTFRLQSRQPFLSHALSGDDIGLEEVGDGIWNIVYYTTLLGKIDDRTSRITGIRPGAYGVNDVAGLLLTIIPSVQLDGVECPANGARPNTTSDRLKLTMPFKAITPHGSDPVTIVGGHRITAGRGEAFREWFYSVTAEAVASGGFQGARLTPPGDDSLTFTIQFQFQSLDRLHAFWTSSAYAEWRARLQPLLIAPSKHRYVTGLEHWVPASSHDPKPPTYKMAIAVYGALLPLAVLVVPLLDPLFVDLPPWLDVPIVTAVIVVLMSYVAMPAMTRLLSPWLFPRKARPPSGVAPRAE